MLFTDRVLKIRRVLFENYDISSKILIDDWTDDANEIALQVLETLNYEDNLKNYELFLIDKFPDDDFTDFNLIAKKILD